MRREDRLMRRLWLETRDWCRQMDGCTAPNLTAHRDGLHHRSEDW